MQHACRLAGLSLSAWTRRLLIAWSVTPEAIRCDNGLELLSETFRTWCKENGVEIRYIQPGKPNQNTYIERFSRTSRSEVLSAYLFEDLEQVS